jgi:toxin ParE1/3/4
MRLEIKLSRLAELDLEEIWLYTFEIWSLNQANYYQDNIRF